MKEGLCAWERIECSYRRWWVGKMRSCCCSKLCDLQGSGGRNSDWSICMINNEGARCRSLFVSNVASAVGAALRMNKVPSIDVVVWTGCWLYYSVGKEVWLGNDLL